MLFDDRLTRQKVEPHCAFIIRARVCARRQHGAHIAGQRTWRPGPQEYLPLAPALDEEIWIENVVDALIFVERHIEGGAKIGVRPCFSARKIWV